MRIACPPEFVRIAYAAGIADRRAKRILVGEKGIDLWRVAGRFNAIKNPCPHQHIPALHEGTIVGTKPTFPMHPWTFSLETTFSDWGEVSL